MLPVGTACKNCWPAKMQPVTIHTPSLLEAGDTTLPRVEYAAVRKGPGHDVMYCAESQKSKGYTLPLHPT